MRRESGNGVGLGGWVELSEVPVRHMDQSGQNDILQMAAHSVGGSFCRRLLTAMHSLSSSPHLDSLGGRTFARPRRTALWDWRKQLRPRLT